MAIPPSNILPSPYSQRAGGELLKFRVLLQCSGRMGVEKMNARVPRVPASSPLLCAGGAISCHAEDLFRVDLHYGTVNDFRSGYANVERND